MTAMTTPISSVRGDGVVFNIAPVPAARPRVGKFGTYYPKKYNTFRAEFAKLIEATDLPTPRTTPCAVYLEFVCPSPKKPANPFPMGDTDNYIKSVLDSAQGKAFFADDKQVVKVTGFKRYAAKGEQPHIRMSCDEWIDTEDAMAHAISLEEADATV
jgi:Holliday junction resolvase RusA-like endonuclease